MEETASVTSCQVNEILTDGKLFIKNGPNVLL